MVRELFYEDCRRSSFTARVERCTAAAGGWEICLDATAFYPEGGGQDCDVGTLDGVQVRSVHRRGEEIVHLCDGPLEIGSVVSGVIDYDRRFRLMQQHTGEHIVSGLIFSRFGFHNVGFHMGADCMTIDFDGVIPQEALAEIEQAANQAVWQNLPVRCFVPGPEELPTIPYRTKRALAWPVRLVEIPGVDRCACCGVHVGATGEVGPVKFLSWMRFRQGVRLELICGSDAMALLCRCFDQNRQVSQAFSAKMLATGEAARQMNEQLARQKRRGDELLSRVFDTVAAGYAGQGNVLHFEEGLESAQVRMLADRIGAVCGGTAAVFSGAGEDYRCCLVSGTADVTALGRAMNAALRGRGGGKGGFHQGSVHAGRTEIEAFFRPVFSGEKPGDFPKKS